MRDRSKLFMYNIENAMNHNLQFHATDFFKWIGIATFLLGLVCFTSFLLLTVWMVKWLFVLDIAFLIGCLFSFLRMAHAMIKECQCGAKTFAYTRPMPRLSERKIKAFCTTCISLIYVIGSLLCLMTGDRASYFLFSSVLCMYVSCIVFVGSLSGGSGPKNFVYFLVHKDGLISDDIANLSDADLDYFVTCALANDKIEVADLASKLFYGRMSNLK